MAHAATVIGRLAAVGALGAAACFAYGVGVERVAFQVRRDTASVLLPGAEPIKVLHLSDVHLLPRQGRKRDFLRGLAGLEPDLVVNTGDNIGSADAVGPLIESLGRLGEFPGVFVFGSNDFSAPRFTVPVAYLARASSHQSGGRGGGLPTEELRRALEGLGWVDVEQRRAELVVAGRPVRFRGTGDAHLRRDDYAAVAGPASEGMLELGVTHAPYLRVLDAMASDGVDLVFAGHTHGGQVCVPGRGALVTNCDLPPEHAKGLFTHEAGGHTAYVHVSAGVGMSPFAPYRFACPPEVTLLTLTAREAERQDAAATAS